MPNNPDTRIEYQVSIQIVQPNGECGPHESKPLWLDKYPENAVVSFEGKMYRLEVQDEPYDMNKSTNQVACNCFAHAL